MTSDSVNPETKRETKPETFRSHLPAIAAATTGTVLATVLGSYMGIAGTIVGIALGSLASGTISWWLERVIRRSAAKAEAQANSIRARGRQLHPREYAGITRAAAARHARARRWAGPAAFIAAAFIGGVVILTLVEHAAGKPLSAVVQGKPGHGATFGGGAVGKATPASPSPTPTASTTHSAATAPPSSTTPRGATSSPTASTAPAATTPGRSPGSSSTPNSAPPPAAPTVSQPG